MVSIVLFIEYFSIIDDSEYLKDEYIHNVIHRFRDQNIGRFGTDEEFLQYILDRKLPISFNGHAYLKGYRPLVMQCNLARLKQKHHRDYLCLCETVVKLYNEIKNSYRGSTKHDAIIRNVATNYPNVHPGVRFNRDGSIQLTLLNHM